MSNLTTKLKTWGAQGSEYPDGYNYLEDEEPVDAWDNFAKYHAIENIKTLISTVNGRLESKATSSEPSSPEVGHLVHRTDAPATADHEELYYYDGAAASFSRLLRADGDTLAGALDTGGNIIKSSTGTVTLDDNTEVNGDTTASGGATFGGALEANGAALDHDYHSKYEGGTVAAGDVVPIGTFQLADGESLYITQVSFTKDGLTSPVASGIELVIADENSLAGDSTTVTSVLAGDGSTVWPDETGEPYTSYTNSSGGPITVMIGIDNGHFVAGAGADDQVFAGYIARQA